MKILALDSSGLVASVALVEGSTTESVLLAEYTINYKKTHSQTLLPMLDEIVRMTELDLETVDAIAIAAGPGSFTGLRIGSATVKGLGLALDKPLVAVSTLEALACNLYGTDRLICPLMDARRNQVYTGVYQYAEEQLQILKFPMAADIAEIADLLCGYGRDVIFLGDGVPVYRQQLEGLMADRMQKRGAKMQYAPAHLNKQRAGAVGTRALWYLEEGKVQSAAEHRPEYLRMSQAERERAEQEKKIMIRPMQTEDLKAVAELERKYFSVPWSENCLKESLENPDYLFLVAFKKGEAVGYGGMLKVLDEGDILNIVVDEKSRGQGIGRAITCGLLEEGRKRGIQAFTLEVRVGNQPAIHLYETLGFVREGIRKRFYEKPVEDALIMWKREPEQ